MPYFTYFGSRAGGGTQGYYAYTLGAWRILALNSEIPASDGSPQAEWLKAELANAPAPCTAAYWHRPLVSSGPHGDNPDMRDLFRILYEGGVEFVVSGHDHLYERFGRLNPNGQPDDARGVRQFVVGTGGTELSNPVRMRMGSEVQGTAWGVIRFELTPSGYNWQFVPVAGESFRDSGFEGCRSPPPRPPLRDVLDSREGIGAGAAHGAAVSGVQRIDRRDQIVAVTSLTIAADTSACSASMSPSGRSYSLRPHVMVGGRVGQLRGHPHATVGHRHGALNHKVHRQLRGDHPERLVRRPVLQGRGAGDDVQPLDTGESRNGRFSEAVGHIGVRRIRRQVFERQDDEVDGVWRRIHARRIDGHGRSAGGARRIGGFLPVSWVLIEHGQSNHNRRGRTGNLRDDSPDKRNPRRSDLLLVFLALVLVKVAVLAVTVLRRGRRAVETGQCEWVVDHGSLPFGVMVPIDQTGGGRASAPALTQSARRLPTAQRPTDGGSLTRSPPSRLFPPGRRKKAQATA